MALLWLAIFISLAGSPAERKELPNSMEDSFCKSLVLQGQVLQEVGEQQLLDAERSSQTATDQEAVIALRAMQAINDKPLQLLDNFFRKGLVGIQYEEKQLLPLKEYMQELEGKYLAWALEQTKSKEDPRWIALQKRLLLPPLKVELQEEKWSVLEARIVYHQLQLAEQAVLDIFLQDQGLPVYWPFEILQLDWKQAPSFVGEPVEGRIVLGELVSSSSAAINGQLLTPTGKGFYYENQPTAIGKQAYELSFRKENPITGKINTYSKTVHYEVVPQ